MKYGLRVRTERFVKWEHSLVHLKHFLLKVWSQKTATSFFQDLWALLTVKNPSVNLTVNNCCSLISTNFNVSKFSFTLRQLTLSTQLYTAKLFFLLQLFSYSRPAPRLGFVLAQAAGTSVSSRSSPRPIQQINSACVECNNISKNP